ncbi:hypothetical protein ACHAXH_010081 [Discostella pseudostelligera]
MNGDAPESVVDAAATTTTATANAPAATTPNLHHHLLPTSLPSVSPFPHHNGGPTSDRLRNAMSRIAISPNKDAEAWQALITEAQSCYRSILPSLDKLKKNYTNTSTTTTTTTTTNATNVDDSLEIELLEKKLDWIESCYGALLHHFPYAISHYVQLVEIFLRLSAVTVEEEEQYGGGIGSTLALGGGSGGMIMIASMMGGSGATAAGGVGVGVGGAAGGVGGGGGVSSAAAVPSSLLSNPMLTTTDMGVSITPASLMMTSHMAQSGTDRQKMYDAKLDKIFQLCLGADTLDNITSSTGGAAAAAAAGADIKNATTIDGARSITGGLAPHSIDLWLLYIRKVTRDASRSTSISVPIPSPPPGYIPNAIQQGSVLHQQYDETLKSAYRERKDKLRECITKAYELALEKGAGFAQNNHLIWKRYVNYVKSWTDSTNYAQLAPPPPHGTSSFIPPPPPPDPAHAHTSSQKQLHLLRSIYQRGITHPMTGLDQFWQEYEAFERSHSESLGSVLIAEWLPRYQHARSIYLERNRVWNARELMMGRLAVPPVGYSEGDGSGRGGATSSSSCVGGSGGGGAGVGGTGGGGGATTVDADDDFVTDSSGTGGGGKLTSSDATEYSAQIEEELRTLSKWRRRAAYERTNPERLNSSDFAMRVRSSYVEEVCAFARHPEVWYEWSQWELLHGGSTAATTSAAASNAMAPAKTVGGGGEGKVGGGNALRAVAVLSLGMESLPDCALLALAQAEILERHFCSTTTSSEKRAKGESSDGMGECIEVLERLVHRSPTTLGFVLLQRLVRRHRGINVARDVFARARRTLRVREEDMSFDNEKEASAVSSEKKDDGLGLSDAKELADGVGRGVASVQQRMVTNRLKAAVGINEHSSLELDKVQSTPSVNAGFITWHLYTAHATIEHRLGKNPKVAGRIFELGLRKHRTFLSNPPYVLYYANLLLELNDEENLRSLLMRAVSACEEMDAVASTGVGGSDVAAIARKREMQRPLWDMMLKFESILSSRNKVDISTDISSIEARRRRALYGPSNEDVVMGGEGSPDDEEDRNLGTGLHKSSLNEQLIRVEGYDVASRIANGMGRLVDVLTVTGVIGNGEFDGTSKSLDFAAAATSSLIAGGTASDLWGDDCAGGPSDVCYIKRLRFQRDTRTRAAALALGFAGSNQGITSGKLLSRERTAGAAGQAAANPLALQNSPEWLRPLLLLLIPVPKFGKGTVKPPPHLTELALSTLRANSLPANRPIEISNGNTQKKRERDGGNSSDDEEDNNTGGGYSHQFRSRQRLRLANTAS